MRQSPQEVFTEQIILLPAQTFNVVSIRTELGELWAPKVAQKQKKTRKLTLVEISSVHCRSPNISWEGAPDLE